MSASCDLATCLYCAGCVAVCPTDCIIVTEDTWRIDPPACTDCGLCVTICPVGALAVPPVRSRRGRPVPVAPTA